MTTTQPKSQNSKTKPTLTPIPANPFLPPGALTLLIGDPGIGKSLLALDIAARLSRGEPPFPPLTPNPYPPTPPFTTIISSAEDSSDTIIDRTLAAQGSPEHIYILDPKVSLSPKDNTTQLISLLNFSLPKLRKESKNPTLLILDPLSHFLGTYDCSHAASVRRVLSPLLRLANEHQLAILGITHLNKSTKLKSILHRTISSIAYVALARSVLLLTPDDLDPTGKQKLLIPIKSNLTHPTHALAFAITDSPPAQSPPSPTARGNVPPIEEGPLASPPAPGTATVTERPSPSPQDSTSFAQATPTARIEYDPIPITNHPLLHGQPLTHTDPFTRSQLELAEHFLQTSLKDGPLPSATLFRQARTLALSQRTIERARQNLRISVHFDPPTGQWLVSLP